MSTRVIDLGDRMHKGFGKNEYGTEISLHVCDECGNEFSLCPAQKQDDTCGHIDCKSYAPYRDVDVLLSEGFELKKKEVQH